MKVINFLVGLFVLAGLAALVFLAFQVSSSTSATGGGGYTVTADFENVGDLNVKAQVTMAGVRIGRVSNIVINKERYNATVEITLDSEFDNLPIDSSAVILTAGLLGSKYIGIEPGAEDEFLMDGSQIEITQSALVLENLISRFLSSGAATQ